MNSVTDNSLSAAPYVVRQPGDGRDVSLGVAGNVTLKVEGIHSGNRVAIYEFAAPPKTAGPPIHLHRTWDEAFYVIEGEMTFLLDGKEYVVPAGSCVFVPQGVLHTFWNASDRPARQMTFFSPAGIEGYFDALTVVLHSDNQAAVAEASSLMEAFDMEVPADQVVAYSSFDSSSAVE